MNRKLFSRLRQYKLERNSIQVDLADDRKSAIVKSEYVETLPYYEPDMRPATPDDFNKWQIVGAARTWTSPREDAWTLALDNIVQGYGGPTQVSQKLTFEKHRDQVSLVSVEASEHLPTDLKINIDALLEKPAALRSVPIERCQKEGATGYLFAGSRR